MFEHVVATLATHKELKHMQWMQPLSQRYAARLIRYKAQQLSHRSGFSRTDRDDLEQELWLDLVHRLPHYDPNRAALSTFIARIVERKVVSMLRYRFAEMRSPAREEASLNESVLDCDGRIVERHQTTCEAASTWQRLHDLERDLAVVRERLASNEARAVVDALGRGGTVNSIAAELGLSRRAVQRHMAEARQALEDAGFRRYL